MDHDFPLPPPEPFKSHEEFVKRYDLVEWTYALVNGYQEPDRKGIPRDQRRPFSRQKFQAIVYSLVRGNWTMPTLIWLAERIKVAYALARKWTAEAAFKAEVARLRDQYLDGFFEQFLSLLKRLNAIAAPDGTDRRPDGHRRQEAGALYYTTLMMDIADLSWGTIVAGKAHEKIEKALKTEDLGRYAGFLNMLDIICHERLKGTFKLNLERLFEMGSALNTLTAGFHYDMCVCIDRLDTESAKSYGAALSTLLRFATAKLLLKLQHGRKPGPIDPGKFSPLDTPTRYRSLHTS